MILSTAGVLGAEEGGRAGVGRTGACKGSVVSMSSMASSRLLSGGPTDTLVGGGSRAGSVRARSGGSSTSGDTLGIGWEVEESGDGVREHERDGCRMELTLCSDLVLWGRHSLTVAVTARGMAPLDDAVMVATALSAAVLVFSLRESRSTRRWAR